ncbi:flavin reductase family protein [Streptomyces sp. V1I1]|uniref:flavin reductase family protein n=1 Tax=Streptomyces sp. V1I1 TaxID=3042272 RepID=UPI002783C3ED|nr:flavin reductase family protein [Streptomyces sp. V1I1]MDQ0938383.1 flavin reductase (DIM6/NTAB) family NADH-FMN oxidoreductase RutF [Streptomyces sp. V1I1]
MPGSASQAQSQSPPRHQSPDCTARADRDYRKLMRAFPTGVTVVTAIDADGTPRGSTCSSLTSVTLTPPTLLVSLDTTSPTLQALMARGNFAVNLLHARGRGAAEVFATRTADRFAHVSWCSSQSSNLPRLVDDAFAVAECQVAGTLAVGDHTIVLGEVTDVAHTPEVPLLYGFGQYSAWSAPNPQPEERTQQ